MRNKKISKIVNCAVFSAIILVATWLVKIPLPVVGYINAGDAVILLCSFIMGPIWGGVSGAVGASLADLLSGYAVYIPATFFIKLVMGLIAGGIFELLKNNHPVIRSVISAIIAELIMVFGYFLFEMYALKLSSAAVLNILFNAVQGTVCVVFSSVIYLAMKNRLKLK